MRMLKGLLVAVIAVGATGAVVTSIFSSPTAQAASPATVYSSGTMVDVSSDAVVCPVGALPGDSVCTPLAPPKFTNRHVCDNANVVKDFDDCKKCKKKGENGNTGTIQDCEACCDNRDAWDKTEGHRRSCRNACTNP